MSSEHHEYLAQPGAVALSSAGVAPQYEQQPVYTSIASPSTSASKQVRWTPLKSPRVQRERHFCLSLRALELLWSSVLFLVLLKVTPHWLSLRNLDSFKFDKICSFRAGHSASNAWFHLSNISTI